MFRLRKKKKIEQAPISAPVPKQDPAVPRFVARQLLALLRQAHRGYITMDGLLKTMTTEARAPYQHLVTVELRPVFDEVVKMITISEERGLISSDEAANLRAGLPIENPLPKLIDDTELNQIGVEG